MSDRKRLHPAMQRLYDAVIALQLIEPHGRQSSFARLLNTTPQRVKNWESRGPSQEIRLQCQRDYRINASWVETGLGDMRIGSNTADRDPDHAGTPPLLLLADSRQAAGAPQSIHDTPDRWPLPEADWQRFAALPPEGRGWALAKFAAGIDDAEARYLGHANSA